MGTNANQMLHMHRAMEEYPPVDAQKSLADCFAACVAQQMGEQACIEYIHKILGEDLSGSVIPNLQIVVSKPRPETVKAETYYYIGIPTNIDGEVHCGLKGGLIEYPLPWETSEGIFSIPTTNCLGLNAVDCCDAVMANVDSQGISWTDVNGNCLSCWVHQEAMKPVPTLTGEIEYENYEVAEDQCVTTQLTSDEVGFVDERIQAQLASLNRTIHEYIDSPAGATCAQLAQLQRDLMMYGRLEYRAMRQIGDMLCEYCGDGPLPIRFINRLKWIMAVLTGNPSNVNQLIIFLDHEGLVMEPPKIGGNRADLDGDRLDDCGGDEPPSAGDVPPALFVDGTSIPEGAGVCDATAMSEQSEAGESCYSCRTCLLEECAWTAPAQVLCHKMFNGEMTGTAGEWLACLESNGATEVHAGATTSNGFDNWCDCAVKCEKRCLKDDLSYLKDPRKKECTATDMSKRSEENEHCHDCRVCLQKECQDTGDWFNSLVSDPLIPRHWCYFLLKGQRNGTPAQWLACLESDGSSDTSLTNPMADNALIEENGGNRDTWGDCARRCDPICQKQAPVKVIASTENPICTSTDMATDSAHHSQKCFPCRQCLRRQCDYWRDRCELILSGEVAGTEGDWAQCLHHCGGGLAVRRRTLVTGDEAGEEERSVWCSCARECDDRCHHSFLEEAM
jgi:hypothetical protein